MLSPCAAALAAGPAVNIHDFAEGRTFAAGQGPRTCTRSPTPTRPAC